MPSHLRCVFFVFFFLAKLISARTFTLHPTYRYWELCLKGLGSPILFAPGFRAFNQSASHSSERTKGQKGQGIGGNEEVQTPEDQFIKAILKRLCQALGHVVSNKYSLSAAMDVLQVRRNFIIRGLYLYVITIDVRLVFRGLYLDATTIDVRLVFRGLYIYSITMFSHV